VSTDYAPKPDADFDFIQVIRGEIVKPAIPVQSDDEDDIAPGIVEIIPDRTPVLRNAGSAAMVVASFTGRAVGLTARGSWLTANWLWAGLSAGAYLGYRYVRAHDLQEVLGGMQRGADWNKVKAERHARWKFLGWSAVVTAGLNLAGWIALVAGADMTALDYSWAIPPTTTGLLAAATATVYGRYRLNANDLAPELVVASMDDPTSDEPFPLSYCVGGEQVVECVSRALAAEGIGTRAVRVIGHQAWGWEVDVVLRGSTVGKVNAVADQLDAHFDVKTGGTLIDPDPQQAAHLVLRLVQANPFDNMPKPTPHAPNSLDISAAHQFGRCMDGTPLTLVLEGLRILAIGVSGAAKTTGVLRDLAEVITACHNAIALDLDPVKDGLREFEGVMAAPPIRGTKDCEKWLEYLVKMAKGRQTVRNRLNMGDTWIATKDRPAIFCFVDEFIYLSNKGKELFIELLRLGKQSGIYPIAAGQDATSDAMGDAIADTFTLRIMLAARHADIPLVLGQGAIAAGFRPDRLVPAQTKDIKNDAGQSYIKGPGLTRPLLYGWNEHSNNGIKQAVAARKAAGRPWFDRDTLAAAGLLHLADGGAESAVSGSQVVADAIAVMAEAEVDRMRSEVLAEALKKYNSDAYSGMELGDLQARLRDAGAGSAVTLGPLDGMKNPRGYKLDALTAIS
jgi:S-DNA-T family DNA segregation ATPase FtsK/SpoIIIE